MSTRVREKDAFMGAKGAEGCVSRMMHREWTQDPIEFWERASRSLDFFESPSAVLDSSNPPYYKWYPGGKFNACYNCVDRHVEAGRGDAKAVIYESPVTSTTKEYTFRELQHEVSVAAGMLRNLGVEAGDRVVIYMPMIPEAIISMLACARIGAVHSVVFGGFAPHELAIRIDDARPKVILTSSCGIEGKKVLPYKPLVDKAVEIAKYKPSAVVLKQRQESPADLNQSRDHDWDELISKSRSVDCVPLDSTSPLYILYTSGSTGQPKGVLRDSAGYCVALRWSMENLMKTNENQTYWAASDVGWVVGHSYIVYGPLLNGSSTILFEGKPVGTPDAGEFWRVIEKHRVHGLFTAPTALRAIRKEDPEAEHCAKYDLSSLQNLFVAGERCDPTTSSFYSEALNVNVVDNWWQTETGWCICGIQDKTIGARPGSASLPLPGYDVQVLDEKGNPISEGSPGALAVKLPLPPGSFVGLYNDNERYEKYFSEYPGYYNTGDAGVIDQDGYVTILERTDDVINVAAHRLSSGQIEAAIKAHPKVNDAAVIGAADTLKGQIPMAFVVPACEEMKEKDLDTLEQEIRLKVRAEVGPIASLKSVIVVPVLPKTRSGKVLRKNIRGIVDDVKVSVPGTIEDLSALDVIVEAVEQYKKTQSA